MRRRTRTLVSVVAGVLAAVTLASCGGDAEEPEAAPADDSTQEQADQTGAGVFPAVVEHKFGTTTVPEEPERVVSVGLTEQDTLLQLGVVPVATTEWYGEQPHAVWPWASDLLGGAEPEVLSDDDGLEFEKIAALEPDLIVGTNAGMTEKDYQLLSAIAPTVTSVKGSTQYFSSWQDQTLQIARALGREADGEALVEDVETAYAEAAAANPEFEGLTATFSQGGPYDGLLYVYQDGLSTDFLTDLGFTITAGLEEYSPQEGWQAEISAENVGLLDADVMVFATESQEMFDELQDFGTIDSLEAVQEGRSVYTDEVLAGAIYFDTPLAHRYLLENLTPLLAQAAAGESSTSFPSTAS